MPQAMKIPDAKAAVEEARKVASVDSAKSKEQKRGHSGSRKREKESPLRYIDGHLSSQKFGVRTKVLEIRRTSRAPK